MASGGGGARRRRARRRTDPGARQAARRRLGSHVVSEPFVRRSDSVARCAFTDARLAHARRRSPGPRSRGTRSRSRPSRKSETAAYAREHYGIDSWRLVRPRVIVEHFTASTTLLVRVEHVRARRAGRRVPHAAGRLRALHRRHRRDDPPVGAARRDVPSHGGAQLDGGGDRDGRDQRPRDPVQPAAAAVRDPADRLADGAAAHRAAQRDRPQREPGLARSTASAWSRGAARRTRTGSTPT